MTVIDLPGARPSSTSRTSRFVGRAGGQRISSRVRSITVIGWPCLRIRRALVLLDRHTGVIPDLLVRAGERR